MAGGALPLTHEQGEDIRDHFIEHRKEMRSEVRKLVRARAGGATVDPLTLDTEILRHGAFLFSNIWLDDALERALNPQRPRISNSDGEEIAFTTVRYPLKETIDRKALKRALTGIADFHRAGEGLWNWSVPATRKAASTTKDVQAFISSFPDGSTSMGHVKLEARALRVGDEFTAARRKRTSIARSCHWSVRRRARRRVQSGRGHDGIPAG